SFRLMGGAMLLPSAASFGHSQTPKGNLDVMASGVADQHFIISQQGPGLSIGNINDGYTAWQNIYFQGGGTFAPAYDGTQNVGHPSYRWGTMYATVGTINTSDVRQKKDVKPIPIGLEFIESLTPVEFKYIAEKSNVIIDKDRNNIVVPVPGVKPHFGLIAQEVKAALVAAKYTEAGLLDEDVFNPDYTMGLNYMEFIAPLVKAVQQLSARVKALEAASGP